MKKIGKTLKNLLYAIPVVAATLLPGCKPDPDVINPPKDTVPPKIRMYSPVKGMVYETGTVSLDYLIEEENFKNASYSVDNGTKVSVPKSGTKDLNLANGNHKVVMYASDLSNNSSKDSVSFSIEPNVPKDTVPPKITISSPLEDIVYNTNDISFSWDIKEDNFKNASYSVDNGTKVSVPKSGTKTISAANGKHKIVLYAEDLSQNKSKDSVSFSADKHSWKYLVNPAIQPNDSTLNWDGSGDANNDNVRNLQDLTRLTEVANGTFRDDNDPMLRYRCDVNGDGDVNLLDVDIERKRISGEIPYMPGEWNKLATVAEQKDWLRKMLVIDKTDKIPFPGSSCVQRANQTMINLNGVKDQKDISNLLEAYPYDFSNSGRFNIPVCKINTVDYNPDGSIAGGHAMIGVYMRGDPLDLNNWCKIETSTDQIDVQFGEGYLIGIDSKLYIRGLPTIGVGEFIDYIEYSVKNKISTLIKVNPDIGIITDRGK